MKRGQKSRQTRTDKKFKLQNISTEYLIPLAVQSIRTRSHKILDLELITEVGFLHDMGIVVVGSIKIKHLIFDRFQSFPASFHNYGIGVTPMECNASKSISALNEKKKT